ncbi:MAG: hydroxymethylbilane synthase [Proteobacteria bacterium]|nr:hydroxymethylbilane synthase [Pseudomonadota bacterium]
MTQKMPILATRGSMLALWQANYVADLLRAKGLEPTLNIIKTTGDVVQDRFLHEIGGKGLFIKELEEAMKAGQADLAMHSLKDLPVNIPEGFVLPAILKRHSACDAIIFKKDLYKGLGLTSGETLTAQHIKALGPMRIATSSLRRQGLLEQLKSGIIIQPVRGNVDTRLRKLEEQNWSALILAEASLDRLSIKGVHAHRLDPSWFVPCAGQGALAIETIDNSYLLETLRQLNCSETFLHVSIERSVLRTLGGDCTMPFGCLVQEDGRQPGNLLGRAVVLDLEGASACAIHTMPRSEIQDGLEMSRALLAKLESAGVRDVLKRLKISHRLDL